MKRLARLMVLLLVTAWAVLVCALPSHCAIIRVKWNSPNNGPGNDWDHAYRTVTAGLAAAVQGDQVWVAKGTYVERIVLKARVFLYGGFAGGETSLNERNWTANVTILDGNRGGSVVTSPSEIITFIGIDGFTIRNGLTTSAGGGIYCSQPGLTIANNTIVGNTAATAGGGIYVSARTMITNNTIKANNAADGGGIYLSTSAGNTTIANNIIAENSAHQPSGLHSGGGYGGGIYISAPAAIKGNTIVANGAARGGAVYVAGTSSAPRITNSIIAFNSTGIYVNSGSAFLMHNCVYGNTAYNYSGIADPTGIDGNISQDPRFAPTGIRDWHIQPDSPCFGTGRNSEAYGPYDIDGQPRIQPAGGTVDIGADESDGAQWQPGPYVVVRVSTQGNNLYDGSSWSAPKRTVEAGINAASASGGEVWVRAGTYNERVTLGSCVSLYGGFAGGETDRDQRDPVNNLTILDGQEAGSVVTVRAPYQAGEIDGFTIQNGTGTLFTDARGTQYRYGGGIYCLWSSPNISHCTVVDNSATFGGGAYFAGGAPTLTGSLITQNSVPAGRWPPIPPFPRIPPIPWIPPTPMGSSWGGGILCEANSLATIAGNVISENQATDYCAGGIELIDSPATVTGNRIEFNRAYRASAGIDTNNCSPVISNNVIRGNVVLFDAGYSTGGGAGLWTSGGSPVVTNNTFVDNHTGSRGGAIWLSNTTGTFANNIVAFNSSGIYGATPLGSPVFANNCFSGNTQYDHSGVSAGATDIFADPLLADWHGGDCHLMGFSPCIDAGWNDAPGLPLFDFDGQGRIWNGTVDIGADEVWPIPIMIDIKPGAYPNPINLKSNGLVPVAILSDGDFSAESVDPAMVTFAGAPVARQGRNSKLMAGLEDVDGDGDLDLLLHFETRQLQVNLDSTSARLVGWKYDGWPVEGWDSIVIVPR